MSAVTETRTSTEPSRGGKRTNRPRGGNPNNRGSNRNARPAGNKKGKDAGEKVEESGTGEIQGLVEQLDAVALSEAGSDMDVCWICAEPVKYYSLSECNHRTCHVCAIRLRALYKKTECTFCKEPQTHVIFTNSPDAPYSSYTPELIPFKDSKLAVSFETQEMMEDTLILLRFNCADQECDYIGNGWGDLRLHARATHGKLMCDLCIRHKKVFSHEHTLYSPSALAAHLPSMNQRQGKGALKEAPEGGVHPLCAFCRECFFGDDELYAHMRERHEECFVCKRNEVRDQYFQNYESLERHFNNAHHPCTHPECLARKFVVFNTALDLKAHMVEEHGGDMTARDRKDARRVQAEFAFEEVGHSGRHARRDRERDRDRDRDREPPPHQQQQQPLQASTSTAPARPTGGGGRRREGFGGALTEGGPTPAQAATTGRQTRPSTPQPAIDVDPAVAERHAGFLARLQSLAPNPSAAVPSIKAATRSYRLSESSARDLILTVWNVMDRNLEHTASIVNAFIDLVDEEEKKQDLLSSWKGFALEQRRQFPDLTPTSIGAGYAGITSGRVLNAKHATAARSSPSQQVWNRVALAASNSSADPSGMPNRPRPHIAQAQPSQDRFPALAGGIGSSSSGPAISAPHPQPLAQSFRQPQRATPWSASSIQPSGLRSQPAVFSTSSSSSRSTTPKQKQASLKLSNSLFPELPTSSAARSKPQVSGNVSLKNILGTSSGPAVVAWGAGPEVPQAQAQDNANSEEGGNAAAGGKGKKSKGKQKQTLFTLGSFPA